MIDISGKKILFIAPKFFGYELEIKKELESFGAEVTFFAEKPYSLYYRVSRHIGKRFEKKAEKNYLDTILASVESFDYFFLIRGEIITEDFLKSLKQKNQNAKFIMYQWDSVKNNPNYVHLMKYFDKVSTFDMVDAKTLNINYLPLFYIKKYENLELSDDKKYDIVFFGTYHGDRLEIVKKVSQECERLRLRFRHHLFIPKLTLLKRLLFLKIRLNDLKYLNINSVSIDDILKNYKITKAVLDIESPNQNGLTMRTIEVLGGGLKLITTNKKILDEDIYNESNILVINRQLIKIDKEFLDNNINIHSEIIKFNINSWVLNNVRIS